MPDKRRHRESTQDIEALIFAAEMGGGPKVDLHECQDTLDGVRATEFFIDEQVTRGAQVIAIIHGRGTGAMRKAVHEMLCSHPAVEQFRDAQLPQSIMGVTYVVLKKSR